MVAFLFPLQQASCSYIHTCKRPQYIMNSHDLNCHANCLPSCHRPGTASLPALLRWTLVTRALPLSCPLPCAPTGLGHQRPEAMPVPVPPFLSLASRLHMIHPLPPYKAPGCQCLTAGSVASVSDRRTPRLGEEVAGLGSHAGEWHSQNLTPEPYIAARGAPPRWGPPKEDGRCGGRGTCVGLANLEE